MLQLAGAALIVISGAMLGFYQADQLAGRAKKIRQFIQALQRLETEIVYGMNPLAEALEQIAKTMNGPVAAMLSEISVKLMEPSGQSALEIWQRVIKSRWPMSGLQSLEKEAVLQLGSSLGISDREDQMKHLQLAIHQLQTAEAMASEDYKRFGKMWKSLGFLAGALVVVLMY